MVHLSSEWPILLQPACVARRSPLPEWLQILPAVDGNGTVIVDSDKGAVDFAAKQANNTALKTKVESVNGEFEILRKREIENYYHLEAIKRLLPNVPATIDLDTLIIEDYNDVKDEIQFKILDVERINFKKKNNMSIFREMTRDEWIEASFQENGTTDIQLIIERILAE